MKKVVKKLMPKSCWRRLRFLRETIKNRKIDRNYLKLIREKGSFVTTPMDEQILSKLPREYKSVLEVGTGGGRLTYWFAYHGYQVVGIEPDKWYRALVNKFMDEQKLFNCKIVDGDIHNIPFANNSFDIVVCNLVIEHIRKPNVAVCELVRCARKTCIVAFPVGVEDDSPSHIHHFGDEDVKELFKPFKYSKQIVYDRPGGNQVFLVTIYK